MRSVAAFFALALGFTWLMQLPAVLAHLGILAGGVPRFMLPAALAGFGPVLAAVLCAYGEGRGAGVRALFRPIRIWRVGAVWYLVALGIFTAIFVAGTAVYRVLGGPVVGSWLYPPENAQHVSALILIPLVEEPGWRGFALPRLQARYGPPIAALLVGAGWAAWHTTMFVLQGATGITFAVGMANVFAGSVIFSWIYNRTRQSLLLAIVAHAGVHLSNPFHAIGVSVVPLATYTVAIAVVALLLVIVDRRAWT